MKVGSTTRWEMPNSTYPHILCIALIEMQVVGREVEVVFWLIAITTTHSIPLVNGISVAQMSRFNG